MSDVLRMLPPAWGRGNGFSTCLLALSAALGAPQAFAQGLSPQDPAYWETPEYYGSHALAQINASPAYALGFTGANVKVGVADSGIDGRHPEFTGRLLPGYDFTRNIPILPGQYDDPDGHGTHVTGIIAAARNDVEMQGVAFNALIIPARVGDGGVFGLDNYISTAWPFLIAQGASIINSSFSLTGCKVGSPPPCNVTEYTRADIEENFPNTLARMRESAQAGVLMVIANGNAAQPSPDTLAGMPYLFPELHGNILAVAALDANNRMADFSNRCGVAMAWCVSAPGDDIYSTYPLGRGTGTDRGYKLDGGTSQAAPVVSGVAALVKEAFPWFTAHDLQQTILTTATDLGAAGVDEIYGWGLVNAGKAVRGYGQFTATAVLDTQGYTSTFANDISGVGGLVKAGAGTLILAGTNSYAGGTAITGGTLQLGAGGTTGSILGDVVNNGVLAFKRSDAAGFAGTISGTGAVLQSGSGTLSLTGQNSYSGGTTVTAGTLSVGADRNLGAPTSALTLNGGTLAASASFTNARAVALGADGGTFAIATASNTLTLSGSLTGTGGLTKTGDGRLLLLADTLFIGVTTVAGGTLQIGNGGTVGMVAGDIVNNAALVFNRSDTYTVPGSLSGTGTLAFTGGGTALFTAASDFAGAVALEQSTLRFQPGSSTASAYTVNAGGVLGGTATIGGLTLNAGGTVAPGYSPGTLTVNGPVTFNAGSVFMQTTDTLTGTFGSVAANYAFLDPTLSYDAQTVFLTLTYTGADYISFAQTANQATTAVAAQALGNDNAVHDAILMLAEGAVPGALNALSGELYPSLSTVIQQQSIYLRDAVTGRLRQAAAQAPTAGSATPLATAATAAGPATAHLSQDLTPTLWAQGYGGWGSSFSNGNAASITNTIGGVFAGADVDLEGTRIGVFGGFSQSSLAVADRSSSASMDGYDLGLYAGTRIGAVALRGGAAYGWHDVSTARTILFPGFLDATTAGAITGTAQLFAEAGYQMAVGGLEMEPFVGLAYLHVGGGSFSEGGGAGALLVDLDARDTLTTTLGLRAAARLTFAGRTVTPSLTLGWQHAFGDLTPEAQMRFAGGLTAFTVAGVPIAQDAALVGADLGVALSDRASLTVSYLGQIGSAAAQNAFTAKAALQF
ncbi:MAG: hypothetical protein B7Z15_10610 [Rhizobiales bacterium 32-66-8]|nr:MAG: hypothetical protein B7Z15_10610 [Rhizobiales bacterium 32-66-8]